MTSLSDGLGPQKDPNSGRTRVESGPAGTHRPTTRRGSAIAQPSVPPGTSTPGRRRPIASRARPTRCSSSPGAPRVRAGPSHRHARRAAGDRGPWVSLPLRATIPEGNTVGQHADVDVGPSHRAPGLRARGHRRIDAGDIDAGETTSTPGRRVLVVTDGAPGLIAGSVDSFSRWH